MRQGKKVDLRALQTSFLDRPADGEPVTSAAKAIGAARCTVYRWRAADKEFKAEWDLAYQEGTDLLEAEAQRRAVDGVPDFRLDRHGNEHPFVRYSDTLLMFLLKARQPEKYRDNSTVRAPREMAAGGRVELEHRGVSLADVLRVARDAGLVGADGNGGA